MKYSHLFLTLSLSCVLCVAGSRVQLNGTVYAYDPIMHLVRHTFVQNMDVIILKLSRGQREQYVKVEILSFGQTLPESSFRGHRTVHLSAMRDKKCDEATPAFVVNGSVPSGSGHYIVSSAYDKQPIAKIVELPCYVARIGPSQGGKTGDGKTGDRRRACRRETRAKGWQEDH